ncbi:cytochrome b b6 petb-like protein [Colletotrichum tabaci]|uniref:Cytochrome b b6 petb-like protein n=1 Tax=Colletotrichum tabaci TaxID=1209068 RepID=A0AAV9T245_9PEZI
MDMMDYNMTSSHPQEDTMKKSKTQSPPPPPTRHGTLTNFCIGFLMVFSIFSIGREVKDELYPKPNLTSRSTTSRDLGSWGQALDSIVTPDTVEAIGNDPRLRRTLMSMVDFTVDFSDQLVARYESPQLQETREALQEYKEKIKRSLGSLEETDSEGDGGSKITRRQFPTFGGLFGAAAPSAAPGGGTGNGGGGGLPNPLGLPLPGAPATPSNAPGGGGNPLGLPGLPGLPTPGSGGGGGGSDGGNPLGGLLPGAGGGNMSPGILSGLLQPLTDGLKNVGNQLVANLNGPGMFLGIGIGAGAAQGLNLSTQAKTMEVASKVAADNNMEATGLNPAIQNLGVGLTSTLLGAVDFSTLGGNVTNQLQPIALSLATGLGNGTVAGLKLNPNAASLEPVNDSSIPNVIGTFGFGLTKTVVSNINTDQLFKQANNTDTIRQIMRILPAAASGFGKGLGQGATVGLGLQPDAAVPMQQMPDGSIDFGGISQTFAKGLTSSFLQNGTAGELLNRVGGAVKSNAEAGGGGIPSTINFNGQQIEIGKVAQGFARGFLQGAGDSIQSMGGVRSLFEGNATMPTGAMPDSKVQFDDSLGGAASGFGVGIGGQGVLVAYGLVKNPRGTPLPAAANAPAAPASAPAPAGGSPTQRRDVELVARQDPPPIVSVNTTDGFNLSVVINAQTISMAAQAGVNALTCQGIGGLGLIGFGLIRSKTIALDMVTSSSNTTKVIKQVIPTGTIRIANEGHTYAIDGGVIRDALGNNILGAAGGIEINGFKLPAWIAFLIIHILFAIVAYANVLPLALGLEHLRNLLLRINVPQVLPNVHKWNNIMWLFVMGPSIVVVFIFGVLVTAKSAHFRTAHGIISLLTTLIGLGAFLLHLAIKARAPPQLPNSSRSPAPAPMPLLSLPNIRVMANQLFLIMSFASVITGFSSLSSVALCFTQVVPFDLALVIGFSLFTVFVLGWSISGLDIALVVRDFWLRRKGAKVDGEKGNFA